jgi:hypothetical protein
MAVKEYSGKDLSGRSGDEKRILLIKDIQLNLKRLVEVFKSGKFLTRTFDYNIDLVENDTKITFLVDVLDEDYIVILYMKDGD